MNNDFTTHVNRRGQGSIKWELMIADAKDSDLSDDVVPLSVADMEFVTAEPIRAALHKLVDTAVLGYTQGTDEFFRACISWQERRHGWTPSREWIVTSPGVVPALHVIVRALTSPGDGIIVQQPVYYPFLSAIKRAEARTVVNSPLVLRDGRYEMDFDDLECKASDPNTKMLILCSPHNPVGRVWKREELKRVVDICCKHNVVIVSDEIHDDLVMPGHAHTTLATVCNEDQLDKIVVCTAPSKTFNLAGCQASIIYVPGEEARHKIEAEFEASAISMLNAFAYTATTAAYNECEGWLDELISVVWDNFCLLKRFCERHPELVCYDLEGTYLAWVDFSAWGLDNQELSAFIREEALLYLDDGFIFGEEGSGFERFNLACPTDLFESALARLESAIVRAGINCVK